MKKDRKIILLPCTFYKTIWQEMNPTPLFLLNSPKSQNKLPTQYKLCCIPKAEVKNKILDALIGKKTTENVTWEYISTLYLHTFPSNTFIQACMFLILISLSYLFLLHVLILCKMIRGCLEFYPVYFLYSQNRSIRSESKAIRFLDTQKEYYFDWHKIYKSHLRSRYILSKDKWNKCENCDYLTIFWYLQYTLRRSGESVKALYVWEII